MSEYLTVGALVASSWVAVVAAVVVAAYSVYQLQRANGHSEFIRLAMWCAISDVVLAAMLLYIAININGLQDGFGLFLVFALRVAPLIRLSYLAYRIREVMTR